MHHGMKYNSNHYQRSNYRDVGNCFMIREFYSLEKSIHFYMLV